MQPRLMLGFSDYIQALESESRKIHVFSKELPLSLELVTQAIEACRLQLRGRTTSEEQNLNRLSECSSGQTSSQGPVLEEFIPLKKRPSSDCGEEDEEENEQHSHKPKIAKDNNNNTDKKKSDWLRSVQLWNPQSPVKEGIPRKTSVSKLNGDGGAFRPFHREASVGKTTVLTAKASSSPASAPPVAGSNKREEKEGHNNKRNKQRRCWSQELHKRFVNALQQLGGADSATPKQIRELMKVDGLTNDEVKSHLQKFRLHTKRLSPLIQNNNDDSQAASFVIVGNFIVGPPEHAAAVPGFYAPVTSDAAAVARAAVPTKGQGRQLRSNSEDSEVADHTNSPTTSSSTHTITASHLYSI